MLIALPLAALLYLTRREKEQEVHVPDEGVPQTGKLSI